MRKKILFVFIICGNIFFAGGIFSQSKKDTIKTTATVTVEADREKEKILNSPRPVTLLTKAQIQQSGATQISEILTQTPGVFIRNYGGSGGLKLFSLRGANSQQSAILLDGVRISGTQNGTLDLSVLPVSMLEEVELVRSGGSAFFGGSALAGALNLRTIRSAENFSSGGKISFGSFGELLASANANFPLDTGGIFLSAEHSRSEGNFPFSFSQFGEEKFFQRENGDFQNSSILSSGKFFLDDWKFSPIVLLRQTGRGIPGAVVQGRIENTNARLDENEGFFLLSSVKNFPSSRLNFSFSSKLNQTHFRDPELKFYGASGYDENFFSKDFFLQGNYLAAKENFLWEVKSELGISTLQGKMLQSDAGEFVKRKNLALVLRGEKFFLFDDFCLNLEPAIRYDYFSDIGSAISSLFAILAAKENFPLKIRSQWSYNFRPPNFNEMYYLNYGTSNLRPERSNSLNFGVIFAKEEFSLEADGFLMTTRDQIVSVPKSPVAWSAQNLGFTITHGMEFRGIAEFFEKKILLNIAYTFQRASDETENSYTKGKILPYVPHNIFSARAAYNFSFTSLGAEFYFADKRFSLPGEENFSLLPSYSTAKIFLLQKILFDATEIFVRGELDNLFGENYSVIANYPMPGRSFRIGISANYRTP